MKTIAFDIGTRRVGIATSDPSGVLASPLRVFTRSDDPDQDARDLAAIADLQGAELIVVGMPISLRGTEEIAAQHMREFIALLQQHTGLPVEVWDERLTTAIAERVLLEANLSRESRRAKIDQVAAALILQSFLDSRQP
ncbi:MAG: Holliday junction resolvase RuvX [Armatimonadetes bacterium]|jgi:putative Holliday junction resolvase|nr:Holliday junction resolvase RuvX [Armatimonadota bacterium]MDI9587122.1 Holliday junction resolvase RuvX [Acidobacteriota bacterium]